MNSLNSSGLVSFKSVGDRVKRTRRGRAIICIAFASVCSLAAFESWLGQPKADAAGSAVLTGRAASGPNDGRFLDDRIEASLRFGTVGKEFSVTARPSQMIQVSMPVKDHPDLIRKYGFLLHPEDQSGKPAMKHTDVPISPAHPLTFSMVLYCLEETPKGNLGEITVGPADSLAVGGCRPRDKYNQLNDDIRLLNSQTGIHLDRPLVLGDAIAPHFDPAELLISEYRMGPNEREKDPPPAGRCLIVSGIEVCACKVAVDGIASQPPSC
jgi:hypothetical protein